MYTLKISVFRDVMSCRFVKDTDVSEEHTGTFLPKRLCISTWRHTLSYSNFYSHRRRNVKSYSIKIHVVLDHIFRLRRTT
jgi:hypothetical protein